MKIQYQKIENGLEILRIWQDSGIIKVPEQIEGIPVIRIAPYTFSLHKDEEEKNASVYQTDEENDRFAQPEELCCGGMVREIHLPVSYTHLKLWILEQNQKKHFHKIYESENRILKAFLLQTYMIALPIFLGYIVWLLQEQKKKQATDAKERDARIAEEKEVRNANSAGTMLLLRVQLIEYHDKYMKLGTIPSYAYENFCEMYKAYHRLGGNGMITKMMHEIEELHLKEKGD